ncbi:MAG: hypothetical protein ACSLFJ_15180 [Immundisolibacter sp.]|uniref:hypothetical protein n=1 Tax=Immundisolibacter sp. TaxID=1934948 RepID=UPI003EE00383
MSNRLAIAMAALCALAAPAQAAQQDDLSALRAEFEQKLKTLQSDYEARLKALERRVQSAETTAQSAEATAQSVEQTASASPPAAPSAFNPELSLILQGAYIDRAGGERPITGFMPAGGHADNGRGFTLNETELVLASNIDPYSRGLLILAVADEEVR